MQPRDYNISVLEYAIDILESFLDDEDDTHTLQAITNRVGVNKSRAFRILSTLQQRGWVEQSDGPNGYRLGLRLLELGEAVRRRLDLVQLAAPALDDLARQTGETIFLGVADGLEAVCVDKREGSYPIRLYAEVGRRAPLYTGGVPKVLLAYLVQEDGTLLDQLQFTEVTAATITDRAALREQLARIRAVGYVVTRDDLDWGACSIAAPIRDYTRRVVASISVAGPNERFTPDRMEYFVPLVRHAADRISAALGYRVLTPAGELDGVVTSAVG